ncbi:hypothetical protein KZZ52_15500 [Dactylosporangium sp. AC04546]|uniref:WXG100 family type VII secretion target n=1 Tax=Dactylosporangium sp. AC04546 TaxID=2862460 RepID=UPI001EDDE54A|nr:WXG100 family type VII secretion target [Dactylosporangium sp. AC04546]WVK86712.1 hypothetical protein KZZ52_15500 [Dactylosporangium sp. AC04546]
MTQPMDWTPTVRDILGAEEDIDSTRVSNPAWIGLDMSFWESRWSTEEDYQRPWEHWMPNGSDWNKITLYRVRKDGDSTNFQLIRATVYFYEGGDNSPSKQAKLLVDTSRSIIDGIDTNQYLDPAMFRDVATRFRNVHDYLTGDGQTQLRSIYDEIENGGVIEGSAADAFAWAIRDMFLGMQQLGENISGRFLVDHNIYVNTGWPYVLDEAATEIDRFRDSLWNAWQAYTAWEHYDPNTLVDALLKSMEHQVDIADRLNYTGDGDRQEAWTFDFSWLFSSAGNATYDLIQQSEWVRLNDDLKQEWISHYDDLDQAAQVATRNLISSYNDLLAAFGRGVINLPHLPYPGTNPFGDGPGNENGFNGPGTGDIPPETGGSDGSVPPPSESGGFDGAGGGSGGIGGTEFGGGTGGLDGAGLGGAGGGSGSIGGTELGAGLDGPGGGPGSIGGTEFGGGSGGLGGTGLDGPGVGSGGGTGGLGGVIGTGMNTGAGLGTGGLGSSGRSGAVVGSGGSDDDTGAGLGTGGLAGGTPSPLDPDDLGFGGSSGSGGFGSGSTTGGDLGGFGSGSGLTPDRSGGFVLGPLGTPPAGYTPSGITNFPAAAVAGGALASGGQNIGGLPGAMAYPTPASDGGSTGAASSMGGMPFMPPMGGMGNSGNQNEKERERTTWLAEEEDVWGTDPDVTAAVIGREDVEPEPATRPARRPTQPRTTPPTYEPSRGRGTR